MKMHDESSPVSGSPEKVAGDHVSLSRPDQHSESLIVVEMAIRKFLSEDRSGTLNIRHPCLYDALDFPPLHEHQCIPTLVKGLHPRALTMVITPLLPYSSRIHHHVITKVGLYASSCSSLSSSPFSSASCLLLACLSRFFSNSFFSLLAELKTPAVPAPHAAHVGSLR